MRWKDILERGTDVVCSEQTMVVSGKFLLCYSNLHLTTVVYYVA